MPVDLNQIKAKVASRDTAGHSDDNHDHHVSRATINFWLDALLAMLLVSLAIVSTIVQFVFPPGTGAKGWLLWGMNFNQWASIQYGVLAAFGLTCVLHVMLHWSWVCTIVAKKLLHCTTLPDDGVQTILGVGFLIVLLLTGAAVVGIAMMTVQMPAP